jgi:hypothetical protein
MNLFKKLMALDVKPYRYSKLKIRINTLLRIIFKPFKWLFFYAYSEFYQWLLERKVKEAVRRSKLENRRYIVTMFFGRPKCYSKKNLKEAIKRRKFKKGVTISDIEKHAYFVTN